MCHNAAEFILFDGYAPDNFTLACARHHEEMKSDNYLFSVDIEPKPEVVCCYIAVQNETR